MRKNTKSSISSLNKNDGSTGHARSWIIFLAALFLSTFFGGAIRAFLSPQQLSSWVEKKLSEKNPKFFLNFDQLEFRLAEGSLPKFGFYIKGLKITSKDPCVTQSQLSISEVYLPIRLDSLFNKRVSFSNIEAEKVEFIFREPVCNSNIKNEELISPPSPQNQTLPSVVEERSTRVLNAVRTFVENRFLKELNNSRMWFKSLSFKSFHIYREDPEIEGFIFDNFFVDLNKFEDKLVINTQVSYQSQKYLVDDFKPLDFELTLAQDKVYLQGKGRFKEGEISLHGSLDIPTEEFSLKFESKYFPVGEILKSLSEIKEVAQNWKARLLWFSCQASAQGLIGDYKNIQIEAKDCGFRGEAGKLFTKEITFYPFLNQHIEPFVADVENFSLKYLTEIMGGKLLDSTFTDWGRLDGQLEYNAKQLRFNGKLNKMELIFSKSGKKRLQLVREAKGEVTWENNRVSGIINEIDLAGGEFSGVISFNLDEAFRSGVVQAKIDSLLLNRSVLRLLVDADLTPLQVYGKMSLKNGVVEEWQGFLGAAEVSSPSFSINTLKVDTKYGRNLWDLGVKIEKVEVETKSPYFAKISNLLIQNEPPEKFVFGKLKVNLLVQSDSGEWKELSAKENLQNILISSSGKWSGNYELMGWINVEVEDKKWMPWELTGSIESPNLYPSTKLLKAIRPQNSTVNIDDKMDATQRVEAFEKIMISRKGLKPKGITEKLVDSAKKWIPDFSNDSAEPPSEDTKENKTE